MVKFLLKFFVLLLIVITSLIIYLSIFGIKTDKFNDLIKNKANEVNRYTKLEFNKTKILLNVQELNLVLKIQNPKILIKENKIYLSKLDLFLSLKSFFSSNPLLKRAEVAFKKNDIKDLTKVTRVFLPRFVNKKLRKIFERGNLEGEIVLPFESNGEIGKDYTFSGKITGATINFNKDLSIKNLTTIINRGSDLENKEFLAVIKKGSLFDLDLTGSEINLEKKKDLNKIKCLIHTNGKVNFEQIKKISALFNKSINFFEDINGTSDLKTNINFELNKNLKVKNLEYKFEGNISHLQIDTNKKKIVEDFLPNYDPKIILKDTKIKFINSKSNQSAELDGFIAQNEQFKNFKVKENYNHNNKNFNIEGIFDLTNTKVDILKLNYKKKIGKNSKLNFDINFILNKFLNIKKFNFIEGKTKIHILNMNLNKDFQIDDFKKIEIKTYNGEIKNNDFLANKSNEIITSGKIFDGRHLLKSLYKKNNKKIFSRNFNSLVNINFDKILTDTGDDVSSFTAVASIHKGSYEKLNLKGNFSENEIIEMSIYQIDKDKKTIQVISDRARPFIKNFNFVKGFEGGKLEYETTIKNGISHSNLLITNFKVSKVPSLAKLLTLASLQGIADTLSGEGIRFESFEMKSNSEGNVLNIDEALALGPAVSILLNGYVDKGRLISLNGTLVPATMLNSIIASIPLIGDILVGKKSGEGVIGVSFKMKGPPKEIKTTVNPIKTLTPRFILRALEKRKKKKEKKTK